MDESRVEAHDRLCEERSRALERLVMQMFKDRDERVVTALKATDRRLDLLNEFRRQSADESAKFAVREVVDVALNTLAERVSTNASSISRLQGRALAMAGIGGIFGAVIAALVVGFFA